MNINPGIFRAYDIRGVFPDEINKEAAYRIGRAYVSYLRNNPTLEGPIQIVVSSDARGSSPELKQELIRGITDEDARTTVIDAGLTTTPMHYFAVNYLKAEGGVMVTASHNPKEYNGFKLSREGARPIYAGGGMEEVKNAAVRGVFETPTTRGAVEDKRIADEYIDFLLANIPANELRPLKVVFDCGNGMTGLFVRKLAEKLPISFEILYEEADMSFPNHEANPLKDATLDELRKRVKETKADLGVAFDGDGDRIGFLTHEGVRVPSDFMTALFASFFAAKEPGARAVYDLRSSKVVPEAIKAAGGVPLKCRVGHPFVKALMRQEDAVMGGEVSGHSYFRSTFYAESSFFAFITCLMVLSESGKTLKELAAPLYKYFSSGEIDMKVDNREKAIDMIAARFKYAEYVGYLDGLSVEYPDFWFNVRSSNTEPLLRVNIEGRTKKAMEMALSDIRRILGA